MSEESNYRIPDNLQPRQADLDYDLDATLQAVVSLRARIPEDAFTAGVLGTERSGHGILINDSGLVATIGYLVTEAEAIWIVTHDGRAVPGHLLGYDYESGFGLVQALGQLDIPSIALGHSRTTGVGDELVFAGYGGRSQALKVKLAARREFAGYWEYLLDEALFTVPPHPNWGGAALIGRTGHLIGIGSLYIDSVAGDADGNLSVPAELLDAIMAELQQYGRTLKPARPWLGMFTSEIEGELVVAGMYDDAPAARAGLKPGDLIRGVGDMRPQGLGALFRSLWSIGDAGCSIPIQVQREDETVTVVVESVDRRDFWKAPALH